MDYLGSDSIYFIPSIFFVVLGTLVIDEYLRGRVFLSIVFYFLSIIGNFSVFFILVELKVMKRFRLDLTGVSSLISVFK